MSNSTSDTARQRSYATGVKLHLGPFITLTADAVPVRRPNSKRDVSFSLVCPECVTKVSQQWSCENGHGPFLLSDLKKARQADDGTFVEIAPEDLAEIAGGDDVELANLQLIPCLRSELEASTRPAEGAYRMRLPAKKRGEAKTYALLVALAQHPTLALYGVAKLRERTAPTTYTLSVWRDQLVIQSLIRPQDLAEPDESVDAADPKFVEMGTAFLEQLVEPFQADLLADTRIDRLAAIMAAKVGTVVTDEATPVTSLPVATDLFAALEASLKAVA